MSMNADSAFCIGSTHSVCQDYVISGRHSEPHIIVSDGCSGSRLSDFGSRILCKVVQDHLWSEAWPEKYLDFEEIMMEANEIRRISNLPQESLDATLLSAWTIEGEEKLYIQMLGDGVLVKIRHDGIMEITIIEYPSGAPYYPNYMFDSERKKQYLNEFGTSKKITNIMIDPSLDAKKQWESGSIFYEDGVDALKEFRYFGNAKDYKMIGLFSDGILSFLKRDPSTLMDSRLDLYEILPQLMGFPSYDGEFVQRRFNKFKQTCNQNSWRHLDDLSLGVIYLGEK